MENVAARELIFDAIRNSLTAEKVKMLFGECVKRYGFENMVAFATEPVQTINTATEIATAYLNTRNDSDERNYNAAKVAYNPFSREVEIKYTYQYVKYQDANGDEQWSKDEKYNTAVWHNSNSSRSVDVESYLEFCKNYTE